MICYSDRLTSLELVAVLSLLDQGDALRDMAGPEAEPGIRKLVQGYLDSLSHVCGTEPLPLEQASHSPDPLEPRTERWTRV